MKLSEFRLSIKPGFFAIALLLCFVSDAMAGVRIPKLFSDNMVLQRDQPIKVWGWANPGEKINISFLKDTYSTVADAQSRWEIMLKAAPAGGPYRMQINQITLENILMGDVFLCSGQSNMAFLLQNAKDSEHDIKASANDQIRLFTVPRNIEFKELEDIENQTEWQLCLPQNVRKFSAVAYYMARSLQKDLNVPIGLIHSSYGGTIIEGFISAKPLDTIKRLQPILADIADQSKADFIEARIAGLQKVDPNVGKQVAADVLWDTIQPKVPEYQPEWPSMTLPTLWEKAGLQNVDGVLWFYKEIILSDEDLDKEAFLSLGKIADQSVTYFNGTKLGSSIDSRDLLRNYTVPQQLLKGGTNRIMVRVANKGRNGGMWGPQEKLYFQAGNGRKIQIDGAWNYKIQDIKVAVHPNDVPSSIYNAMIHPLKKLRYKGVVWYQGESNANWANEYENFLKMLINDWRRQFQDSNLPFVIVQLPNYKKENDVPEVHSTWAMLREAQEKASYLPNVGLVNIIDLGMADDIHPIEKRPVGERTALKVKQMIYHQNITADGPIFSSVQVKGGAMILSFKNAGKLSLKNENTKPCVMIAGEDRQFVWAEVKMKNQQLIVYNKLIRNPVAVRYAWADNPGKSCFYNEAGLPMRPFRTDNWKIEIAEIPR